MLNWARGWGRRAIRSLLTRGIVHMHIGQQGLLKPYDRDTKLSWSLLDQDRTIYVRASLQRQQYKQACKVKLKYDFISLFTHLAKGTY